MKSRLLIFVAVLGIVAVAAGWVYESRLRPGVGSADLEIPVDIDYFLTNLNYRSVADDGLLEYELNSRRLEHRPLNDISLIELPALHIYRDSVSWRVDAQQGELRHAENLLWLRQQVVMQKSGRSPFELRTEAIQFDPERDLVSSETGIMLQGPRSRIEAEAAVFDLAGKVYRLSRTRAVYFNGDN